MKKAIYFNKATNQTYTLSGVKDLQHAYNIYKSVCSINGWNPEAFSMDVKVRVVEM